MNQNISFVIELIHTTAIARSIVHDVIFQNSLNDRDIIFATNQIISSKPKNKDIAISKAFTKTNVG